MAGFAEEPQELRAEMSAACDRVLASHHYVLGPEVEAFEAEFAAASGLEHVVGVANGLDAIEIALRVLEIGPGAEVITTPMTAFATVLGILRAGATPVLADIDPATGLLDPASVVRCITPRTHAVMPVHLYGQLRDGEAWSALAAEHGVALIEDCAQAHLATEHGRSAGSFGPVAAFSFYPTKNLGAIGDAGALATGDAETAALAKSVRNYGQSVRYEHPRLGLNSRLDELQAALLRARMHWLADFTARRRQVAEHYDSAISNPAVRLLSPPTEPAAHVHHQYVVCCDERDDLARHLSERGVETLIHYPVPIHHQVPCRDIARDRNGLANAERHAQTCLSIPCHPGLSDADVVQVVDAVNSYRA